MIETFYITGDPDADQLLHDDPLALLLGMLFDQQVPMEWAFASPAKLKERLGGLDANAIAAMDQEAFVSVCCEKPAIHRFPGSMGKRAHELCQVLSEEYDGDTAAIWNGVDSGAEVLKRLKALPGFGDEKAKIFLAVLAKRMGVTPAGWEEAAAPFSDDNRRTVADADTPEHLQEVRAWKKMMKAQKKGKAD
ncbi:MAG: hypothetical protein JWN29_2161, partial [Acidimicrobiales bacterium]|jgi:uncharacterized HhH-GPD family protein|nr:hypothetical protein [Acidimicrobiales bacterium]